MQVPDTPGPAVALHKTVTPAQQQLSLSGHLTYNAGIPDSAAVYSQASGSA